MSRATSLIPVILLLAFLGGAAFVGYQIFLYTQELADRGQKHMEKKNIKFTADGGMRVGVKEMNTEDYSSKTQNMIVKAWNLSSWPEYRSRFWNKDAQPGSAGSSGGKQQQATSSSRASTPGGSSSRPAFSRHGSSQSSLHVPDRPSLSRAGSSQHSVRSSKTY